jgi:hypothetical protein
MGYRKVKEELLWNVYVRLRTGESNHKIASTLKLDRKTVDHYAERLGALDLPATATKPPSARFSPSAGTINWIDRRADLETKRLDT